MDQSLCLGAGVKLFHDAAYNHADSMRQTSKDSRVSLARQNLAEVVEILAKLNNTVPRLPRIEVDAINDEWRKTLCRVVVKYSETILAMITCIGLARTGRWQFKSPDGEADHAVNRKKSHTV